MRVAVRVPDRIPVVLDCDPGLDDAVALALLAASPEFELLGVTTVAGNVSVTQATQNAGALLELLDLPVGLPLHAGYVGPLGRYQRQPDEPIHGPGGMGEIDLPAPREADPGHAADWLADTLRQYQGSVTIVAIGPLTNVAGLLLTHLTWPRASAESSRWEARRTYPETSRRPPSSTSMPTPKLPDSWPSRECR